MSTDPFELARRGDSALLAVRLQQKPEILLNTDDSNRILLHWAASGGHDEIVSQLLELGSPVDAVDDTGCTPLLIASAAGRDSIVKTLITRGANVNQRNEQGHSSLQYACSKGHKEIAELLISCDADINAADKYGETPLHRAAVLGRVPIIQMLLCNDGLIVDAVNSSGNTALHLACEEDREDVAKILRGAGASLEIVNKEEKTPLDFCTRRLANLLQEIE